MVELDQMKIELQGQQEALKEGIDSLNIPFKKQRWRLRISGAMPTRPMPR